MKWLACLVVISMAVAAEAWQTPTAPPQFTPADEAAIMRVVIDWIVQPANNSNSPVGTTGPVLVNSSLGVVKQAARRV